MEVNKTQIKGGIAMVFTCEGYTYWITPKGRFYRKKTGRSVVGIFRGAKRISKTKFYASAQRHKFLVGW